MKFKNFLTKKAEEKALEMIEEGATIKPIPIQGDTQSIFVSLEPDKILAFDFFQLKGKVFYIGQKK